ncbi:MAG: hypothetical protein QOF33_1727, partial [Thermomicrobiales bacterium]|nr:hypothetical protein [Thermomicrobiales bacterium]
MTDRLVVVSSPSPTSSLVAVVAVAVVVELKNIGRAVEIDAVSFNVISWVVCTDVE